MANRLLMSPSRSGLNNSSTIHSFYIAACFFGCFYDKKLLWCASWLSVSFSVPPSLSYIYQNPFVFLWQHNSLVRQLTSSFVIVLPILTYISKTATIKLFAKVWFCLFICWSIKPYFSVTKTPCIDLKIIIRLKIAKKMITYNINNQYFFIGTLV